MMDSVNFCFWRKIGYVALVHGVQFLAELKEI